MKTSNTDTKDNNDFNFPFMAVSHKDRYITRFNFFLVCHIINILLTELSRSVWENLDLGLACRPHYARSVLTTSVKILPYRPPARLIRANYIIERSTVSCFVAIPLIHWG